MNVSKEHEYIGTAWSGHERKWYCTTSLTAPSLGQCSLAKVSTTSLTNYFFEGKRADDIIGEDLSLRESDVQFVVSVSESLALIGPILVTLVLIGVSTSQSMIRRGSQKTHLSALIQTGQHNDLMAVQLPDHPPKVSERVGEGSLSGHIPVRILIAVHVIGVNVVGVGIIVHHLEDNPGVIVGQEIAIPILRFVLDLFAVIPSHELTPKDRSVLLFEDSVLDHQWYCITQFSQTDRMALNLEVLFVK